jgi:hypothetical protein
MVAAAFGEPRLTGGAEKASVLVPARAPHLTSAHRPDQYVANASPRAVCVLFVAVLSGRPS